MEIIKTMKLYVKLDSPDYPRFSMKIKDSILLFCLFEKGEGMEAFSYSILKRLKTFEGKEIDQYFMGDLKDEVMAAFDSAMSARKLTKLSDGNWAYKP